MSNKTYLITLTPTGKFFFGGDMKFKVGKEDNEEFDSYIIKSNRFPQQTSLLGMLRFLILRNAGPEVFNDNKIINTDLAQNLIGPESFKANKENPNFGVIDRISPCFIIDKKNNEFSPIPITANGAEYDFELKEGELYSDKYNAKDGISDNFSKYFVNDLRMGLLKEPEGKKRSRDEENDALFKQENLRFKNDENSEYCFAFYASIDESVNLTNYSRQIVSLGADSSMFAIEIEEKEETSINVNRGGIKGETVVLTSPSFIPKEEMNATAAISNVIPFKCLQTTVKDKEGSYNRLKRELGTSSKLNLYDKGSVFFFNNKDEKEQFCNNLKSHKEFRQIGYNYFD